VCAKIGEYIPFFTNILFFHFVFKNIQKNKAWADDLLDHRVGLLETNTFLGPKFSCKILQVFFTTVHTLSHTGNCLHVQAP